ncbi:YqzE family protein [Pseudalkalibacillus caeni]|uniref:YqzE family protein n=1 Tax=Exobacillus caeni TaxID=2574798 RepID=A0A5R9EYU6_9BACL|nr:YqzE family protein [Pseudalkalibacillus caeni]TLS36347.1 YqzE family protein [Pseudalkalibacillus caeni]
MKSNDYVKYVTQEIVNYLDQPKEQRKHVKEQKRAFRQPFLYRWFGILPMGVIMMFRRKRNNHSNLFFKRMESKK